MAQSSANAKLRSFQKAFAQETQKTVSEHKPLLKKLSKD
jgi:hypothetical protein